MVTALYDALSGASPQVRELLLNAWLADTGRVEKLGARVQARENGPGVNWLLCWN